MAVEEEVLIFVFLISARVNKSLDVTGLREASVITGKHTSDSVWAMSADLSERK
jgi:hypothetical protein